MAQGPKKLDMTLSNQTSKNTLLGYATTPIFGIVPSSEMSMGRLKKHNKLSAIGQITLDNPPPHHQINNDIFCDIDRAIGNMKEAPGFILSQPR